MSIARLIAPSPIIVAAVAALLFHVGSVWIIVSMPVGLALGFTAAVIIANYALEILEQRARGTREYAVLSIETLTSAGRQRGWIFAAIAGLAGAAVIDAAGALSPVLADMARAILVTALPLAASGLAVTHRWGLALNPLAWLQAGMRLGVLLPAVLGAAYAAWFVTVVAAARQALWLEFLAAYAWLTAAYVVGECLYARRQALGLVTRRSPEDLAAADYAAKLAARRDALTHAYAFAGRGNIQGALDHLRAHARTESDTFDAELWLFREMAKWAEPRPAFAMGSALAPALEEAGRGHEAAKVRAMCAELVRRIEGAAGDLPEGRLADVSASRVVDVE